MPAALVASTIVRYAEMNRAADCKNMPCKTSSSAPALFS